MLSYSAALSPPGPVASIRVIQPATGAESGPLPGKLDTGADLTVLPDRVLAELRVPPWGRVWARSFDGSYSQRLVYYVCLRVEGFELPAIRCMGARRPDALLGRDVLNQFVILLDGKSLCFDLRDP